jgi:histidinol-phosphate aminotransferase
LEALCKSIRFQSPVEECKDEVVHLNRNEYFFAHHPAVQEALAPSENLASRYATPFEHQVLQKNLAEVISVEKEHIFLGHGAEDLLIKVLAFLRINSNSAIFADFSWSNYSKVSEGLGYSIQTFPIEETFSTFSTPLDALNHLLQNTKEKHCVVCLASPNNPTGHTLDFQELENIVSAFPQHTFLLDAVYDRLQSRLLSMATTYANCIFFGSFSKFFGMPGLRVGYAIGKSIPPGFHLNLGLQPWSIEAALASLTHQDWYQKNRMSMLQSAQALRASAPSCLQVFQTEAPFLLCKVKKSIDLQDKNILESLENYSKVRPKYIQRPNGFYLRWGLGPEFLMARISAYHQQLEECPL